MNKNLEVLHKKLVANQKVVKNSSKSDRITKLKKLKKSGFYQDLQQAAAESDAVKRNLDILNRL